MRHVRRTGLILGRRAFLAGATAALWPRPARAQRPRTPPRIGWISTDREPDPFLEGFREGLRQHGYVDGQTVIVEVRRGSVDELRAVVAQLKTKVAFLVAAGPAIRAVRGTQDVSVLFAVSGDPIEAGLAKSLAQPGQNFSGITFLSLEVAAKRIELLKEALPGLRTLAVLSNVDHPGEPSERRASEAAARTLGITLAYVPFKTGAELEDGLRGVRNARPDAMIVFPEGATVANRAKVAEFAITQRLPSMFGWSEYVDAGGLMSYGANVREAYVQLARYADRLLRGARPAELPIVQPTRFELVVNIRTAKLLDLTIPQTITMRAARLIE
ncbi:MAG TPA: ABC transporter substrate-binding protein [Methylomirabilota bacterium]|nr:ABC transporter substrate-binding protein [Methylomirabilota bacterium]